MPEPTSNSQRAHIRKLLAQWEQEREVVGAYAVTLVDLESSELEIRKAGTVPGFSPEQFRKILSQAESSHTPSWDCRPEGHGFSLRSNGKLFGFCVIFPWADMVPIGRWEKAALGLAAKLAPHYLSLETSNTLNQLVEAIPERADTPHDDNANKLHWENSASRVNIPVQAEITKHLMLDHMPLF